MSQKFATVVVDSKNEVVEALNVEDKWNAMIQVWLRKHTSTVRMDKGTKNSGMKRFSKNAVLPMSNTGHTVHTKLQTSR